MTQEVNELVGIDTESAKKLQYHDALLQNWPPRYSDRNWLSILK